MVSFRTFPVVLDMGCGRDRIGRHLSELEDFIILQQLFFLLFLSLFNICIYIKKIGIDI